MSLLVTIPLILVVLGMAGGRWTRRRRDDKSIEAHRSTLGIIEHVAAADDTHLPGPARNSAHVRIVGTPARRRSTGGDEDEDEILPVKPPQKHADRPAFPRPKAAGSEAPAPEPPIEEPPRRPPTLTPPVARTIADQVQAKAAALRAGRSGPSAMAVAAAAGLLVVVAVVSGIVLSSNGHGSRATHSRPGAAGHAAAGRSGSASAPPVTAPPPTVVATAATSSYATYNVNAASLDIHLAAVRPCWIELRTGSPSGQLVYEGTLQPGTTQAFQAVGSVWLRLGNPAGLTVTIDGSSLSLPADASPFDLTLNSPA